MKVFTKVLFLLIVMLLTKPVFVSAQQPNLPKNSDGYYEISSVADYETFRQIVLTGNPYANAVLSADIEVTKPIGSGDAQFHYRGTFDGQGHTITVNMSNDNVSHPWGLFQFTEPGCVIRNLRVTGALYSNEEYFGSIVGKARGTRLENCVSDVTLFANGTGYTGGLIGGCQGVNFVENCAYTGRISAQNACGIIGHVEHNVEIKSCYVDAAFKSPAYSRLFIDKDDTTQIFLNNYYHKNSYYYDKDHNNVPSGRLRAQEVSDDDLMKGRLCLDLNINGRNGVVWYQHDEEDDVDGNVIKSHPYPFKGKEGKMMMMSMDESHYIYSYTFCSHRYFGSVPVCQLCGYIKPGYKLDPLQRQYEHPEISGEIIINNLRFSPNDHRGLTTAEFRGCYTADGNAVTAVHIPDSICVNGKVFTIDYISNNALDASKIEYCYIPKSVNHISIDAFNNCWNLKYLHLADGPSKERLRLEYIPGLLRPQFYHAPLEEVYIGRDLIWKPGDLKTETSPFGSQAKLKKVFFGPRVTRLGNYAEGKPTNDPNNYADELFLYGNSINEVYFMGDEKSCCPDSADAPIPVEILAGAGSDAKYFYVNRNLTGKYLTRILERRKGYAGLLDKCEHAVYGPFATAIADNTFMGGIEDNIGFDVRVPHSLNKLEIENAFRLETIGNNAFEYCKLDNTRLDFSNTSLKTIGDRAFYNSNLTYNFGDKLETIGTEAFYGNQNLTQVSLPGSVKSIGKDAFRYSLKLEKIYLQDGTSPITIGGYAFYNIGNLSCFYLGRDIKGDMGGMYDCGSCFLDVSPNVTVFNRTLLSCNFGTINFRYSDQPLYFDEYADHTARTIYYDRHIIYRDKENSKQIPSLPVRKSDHNLGKICIGKNITSIPEGMFEGYNAAKTFVIPENITHIGSNAFKGCSNLEVLCILGEPTVDAKAFADITSLRYLFLMGSTIRLKENVFEGCTNLKEVCTGFYNDPGASDESAFSRRTYENATLSCAGDQDSRYGNVELTSEPWTLFNNKKALVWTDFYADQSAQPLKGKTYDRASLSHQFPVGSYDMIYLPFSMDSYYFGVDAEIYQLKEQQPDEYAEILIREDQKGSVSDVDMIEFDKVDIDSVKTLRKGHTYLVKVNHDEDSFGAYYSLFDEDGVMVNNSQKELSGHDSHGKISAGGIVETLSGTEGAFVADNGVLKLVNGEYTPQQGRVLIYGDAGTPMVFSLIGNHDTESPLMTSKSDLQFSNMLEGYTSFYDADYNYVAPEWCDVYVVKTVGDTVIVIDEVADRTITKGQAVLLKTGNNVKVSDRGITEYLTYATHGSTSDVYDGNLLRGLSEDRLVSELDRDFVYALCCDGDAKNTGFYKIESDIKVIAGKAYLDPDDFDSSLLNRDCLFVCNGSEATGVTTPEIAGREKNAIYDLMGRRLREAGYKGTYIVNGKKMVVK